MKKPNDWNRFLNAMKLLCETFQRDPSELLVEAYWMGLETLRVEQVERGIGRAVVELKFFPKPVEIRELSGAPMPTVMAPMDLKDEAELACVKAWQGISSVGRNQSACFDDPAIHQAIGGMGGWVPFSNRPDNDYTKKEFKALYIAARKDIARSGLSRVSVPLFLRGEHDEKTPKFVGDKLRIAEWHEEAAGEPSPFIRLLLPPKDPKIGDGSSGGAALLPPSGGGKK